MINKPKRRVEIHVIAGLGGFFTSRGTKDLDRLFDDLSPYWDATHWYHGSWKKCAEGIIARQQRYNDKPIIIIIGHSYGGWRVQEISSRLNDAKIKVTYGVGIDVTALPRGAEPMDIPPNVQYVDEFWSTSGWFNFPLKRRKKYPDGSRGGKYVYPHNTLHTVITVPGGHIPCASNKVTVDTIVSRVKNILA